MVRAAVVAARTGVGASPATPAQRAALARSRCLLDVTYAGSPSSESTSARECSHPLRRADSASRTSGNRSECPGPVTTRPANATPQAAFRSTDSRTCANNA